MGDKSLRSHAPSIAGVTFPVLISSLGSFPLTHVGRRSPDCQCRWCVSLPPPLLPRPSVTADCPTDRLPQSPLHPSPLYTHTYLLLSGVRDVTRRGGGGPRAKRISRRHGPSDCDPERQRSWRTEHTSWLGWQQQGHSKSLRQVRNNIWLLRFSWEHANPMIPMCRALHGANFGDPIQPAPFAQTHFHPFPGFQGKFSPNPLRFHVYEFYINCLLNAKKNSLSFHTNKELKHQDSINMFDRFNGYQMTKSWTLQYWMSNCKFCCLLQLYLWNLKIMINQS